MQELIPLVQVMKPVVLSTILDLNYKEMPEEFNGKLPNAIDLSGNVKLVDFSSDSHRFIFQIFISREKLEKIIMDHGRENKKPKLPQSKYKRKEAKPINEGHCFPPPEKIEERMLPDHDSFDERIEQNIKKIVRSSSLRKTTSETKGIPDQILQKRTTQQEETPMILSPQNKKVHTTRFKEKEKEKSEVSNSPKGFQPPEQKKPPSEGAPPISRPSPFYPGPSTHPYMGYYGYPFPHPPAPGSFFPYFPPFNYGSYNNAMQMMGQGRPEGRVQGEKPKSEEPGTQSKNQENLISEVTKLQADGTRTGGLNAEIGQCLIEKLSGLIDEIKENLSKNK